MIYLDMIADGLEELVVVTAKGLHVFQYNMEDMAERLKQRMLEGAGIKKLLEKMKT